MRSMSRVDLGFKKKTRVNSRGCGKSKRLLKVYLFSILSGKLTYQWHLRKYTHHLIRKVACCQLKLTLNVAAEAKLRMGSHASGFCPLFIRAELSRTGKTRSQATFKAPVLPVNWCQRGREAGSICVVPT